MQIFLYHVSYILTCTYTKGTTTVQQDLNIRKIN